MGFSEKKCTHKSLGSSTVSWQSQLIASIIDKSLAAYIYYYHILLSYVLSYIYDNYYHSSMTGTIQMYYNIHDNLLWYSDNMTQCHLHNEHVHHIYILSTTTSFNQYEWWISMIWSITSVIGKWCFMTSIKIFSLIIIYFNLLSFIYDHLFSYLSYLFRYFHILSHIVK